ncbi:toll/interleukin-1 receptor domain-containing protein [Mucilaginibacter sp. OK098]|uniref:toll/interleukin-1 receptor domain-containing protein n=1 Tax=Mucilaginibacter sp. OK098 TaxID=1855297 RepID=UPI0009212FC6|nr:toll/interleukin-1 receptor domain-containing protein [Mucilaginibacter sp. OK098]SHM77012.1 TIR domain-containing protein [Mucilaginibacter sp. OK098]
MALYTSNYLKNVSRNKTSNERINLSEQRNISHGSFDIFLCHSYLDKEEVEGLYLELTKTGFTVYVDWIVDPQLDRSNVTKESAELVRRRLRTSKTLLLAISANAALSKWMPWELGYVDGNTQLCALIPVAPGSSQITSFTRTEYLMLYPYVEKPNDLTRFRDKLWTVDGANSYVEFDNWIRGRKPTYESLRFF